MAVALAAIDRLFQALVAICICIIVVSVTADVVARYGLRHSIMVVNELSRLSFIWVAFLVMPLAIGRGMHVAITGLETRLRPRVRKVAYRASLMLIGVFMGFLLVSAIISIRDRSGEAMLTMPLAVSWFFVPIALGAAHSILHLIAEFIRGERTVRAVEFE
ncbi:TRAP transporter small permease subunit (plasmid) [Sulfitobacter sp. LCG007]